MGDNLQWEKHCYKPFNKHDYHVFDIQLTLEQDVLELCGPTHTQIFFSINTVVIILSEVV